jgi:MYXO-CTERM domain-containing protein
MRLCSVACAGMLLLLTLKTSAEPISVSYGFELVTQGAVARQDAAYGVTVYNSSASGTLLATDWVRFRLQNTGGIGSVHEIYFDDMEPTKLLNIRNAAGTFTSPLMTDSDATGEKNVQYTWGSANPGHLPGADGFEVSSDGSYTTGTKKKSTTITLLLAGDVVPGAKNGLDRASEWLDLTFQLRAGNNFQTVVSAMEAGDLRVGIHVGDSVLKGGTVDSGAWVAPPEDSGGPPPPIVPLPSAALAGLVLLGGTSLRRRRR